MSGATNDTLQAPRISVSLTLRPPNIDLESVKSNLENAPTLSVTVTSHAWQPVTIFTWHSVFNLQLALKRRSFICTDLTANSDVPLAITKAPKRPGFRCDKDGPDDRLFVTLEPELPVTFSSVFSLARGAALATDSNPLLVKEHRYRLAVREGEGVSWWKYGTKDEVMRPPGVVSALGTPDGEPIRFDEDVSVEFEVE